MRRGEGGRTIYLGERPTVFVFFFSPPPPSFCLLSPWGKKPDGGFSSSSSSSSSPPCLAKVFGRSQGEPAVGRAEGGAGVV